MSKGDGKRPARVAERVRKELSDLFLRGAVRDPRAKDVVVSGVRITDDLRHARVYVRLLEEVGPRRQQAAVTALEKASGFLRRKLGPTLGLRYVPELEFFWDDVVDDALRIERVLHELAEEREEREAAAGAEDDDADEADGEGEA